MEDSTRKRKIQNAVRRGAGKAASGMRSAVRRMRIWQKAGLVLCLLSWIASAVIGAVCARITGNLADQNYPARWASDIESAQISAFLSNEASISEETVLSVRAGLTQSLQADAIVLSDTMADSGASLVDVSCCGFGNAEIGVGEETVSVTVIGVMGDFFNFHPLDLMDGYYFSDDELMQDRILLDDQTAWRLFGSPHVIGMSVNMGGTPHYIAGVFRRPEGRFYSSAGMGDYLIFASYDSLCRYTERGSSSGTETEDADLDSMDADAAVPVSGTSLARSADADLSRTGTFHTGLSPAGISDAGLSDTQRLSVQLSDTERFRTGGVRAEERLRAALAEESGAEAAVPTAASWQPAEYAPAPGADRLPRTEAADEDDAGMAAGSEELTDTYEEYEGEDSADDLDSPADGDSGMSGGYTGQDPSYYSGDTGEKEDVNWNRITCWEVVLPNPVSGYALMTARKCLEGAGVSMNQLTAVENSSRYDVFRLASLTAQPGVRSMQTAAIRYPYWENVALAWEDTLIPWALARLALRYAPILFLVYLLLWYATHKSWTVGGAVQSVQDRIYERQSERLYGKQAVSGITSADTETELLPDGTGGSAGTDTPGGTETDREARTDAAPADGAGQEERPDDTDGKDTDGKDTDSKDTDGTVETGPAEQAVPEEQNSGKERETE